MFENIPGEHKRSRKHFESHRVKLTPTTRKQNYRNDEVEMIFWSRGLVTNLITSARARTIASAFVISLREWKTAANWLMYLSINFARTHIDIPHLNEYKRREFERTAELSSLLVISTKRVCSLRWQTTPTETNAMANAYSVWSVSSDPGR